jgi:hypothetical protein
MLKFFPTNHTLNVNHSFAPTDKPFNINSLLGNAEEEFNLNTDLRELRKAYSEQSAEPTFEDIYTNPFYKPVQPEGLEKLTKDDLEPISTTTENIDTFNKKVQPEGLEKILSPEEQFYNKQKDLVDLYKNTDVEALRINFKVEALYWQPITGSNASETSPRTVMIQMYLYRLFKDGTTTFASMEKLSNTDPYLFSSDAFRIQGKINNPTILHYTWYIRSHADNGFFFEILPNQIGWMIRIDKAAYEDYSAYVKNTTVIESITEVYHDRFTFPNTA